MRYHMANLAIRSYIDCRYGLEQPRGGANFWRAFSGAEFEEGSPRGGDAGDGSGILPHPQLQIPNRYHFTFFCVQ